jgi:hypothetical protein
MENAELASVLLDLAAHIVASHLVTAQAILGYTCACCKTDVKPNEFA